MERERERERFGETKKSVLGALSFEDVALVVGMLNVRNEGFGFLVWFWLWEEKSFDQSEKGL